MIESVVRWQDGTYCYHFFKTDAYSQLPFNVTDPIWRTLFVIKDTYANKALFQEFPHPETGIIGPTGYCLALVRVDNDVPHLCIGLGLLNEVDSLCNHILGSSQMAQ